MLLEIRGSKPLFATRIDGRVAAALVHPGWCETPTSDGKDRSGPFSRSYDVLNDEVENLSWATVVSRKAVA